MSATALEPFEMMKSLDRQLLGIKVNTLLA